MFADQIKAGLKSRSSIEELRHGRRTRSRFGADVLDPTTWRHRNIVETPRAMRHLGADRVVQGLKKLKIASQKLGLGIKAGWNLWKTLFWCVKRYHCVQILGFTIARVFFGRRAKYIVRRRMLDLILCLLQFRSLRFMNFGSKLQTF